MSDVTLQERLDTATQDLSECGTADEIAAILRAEGVKGKLGEACACPLSMLLGKRLDGIVVEVDGDDYTAYGENETARVFINEAAQEFIHDFDRHFYREFNVDPDGRCEWMTCVRCNPPTAVTP